MAKSKIEDLSPLTLQPEFQEARARLEQIRTDRALAERRLADLSSPHRRRAGEVARKMLELQRAAEDERELFEQLEQGGYSPGAYLSPTAILPPQLGMVRHEGAVVNSWLLDLLQAGLLPRDCKLWGDA